MLENKKAGVVTDRDMMASSTDSLFRTLPTSLQRKIDHAFDSLARQDSSNNVDNPPAAGGFLPEDPILSGLGGGFIPDDSTTPVNPGPIGTGQHDEIPFSSIPAALQYLDLPPDDEQVLAVFRNAASGWALSNSMHVQDGMGAGGMINRDDWRSVCAVLLEPQAGDENEEDTPSYLHESDDNLASEDEYHASDASEGESDESYAEALDSTSPRRRRRGRTAKSPSPFSSSTSPLSSESLTRRQRQVALEAFGLFFPSIPASELEQQKIMLKDIQQVTKLLGEKIKAEEMVEMLDYFSTTPDRSIGLADFSRIMIATKLA